MTTKNSSLGVLKAQADKIAETIKRAERGEKIDARFANKLDEARKTDSFKVGIVMDDKIITVVLLWEVIRKVNQSELSEYIVQQMQK